MKKVYSAGNLIEAYHVVNLLAQENIDASVFNENASGASGELPLTVYPEVWVVNERDFDKARRIVTTYDAAETHALPQQCPGCGEVNPDNFPMCWNCGATLRDT